jgi:large subunit ribosomal protein L25
MLLPEGSEIPGLTEETDQMVVSVNAPKAVEEEEPIVEEGAEGEDGTEDAAESSSDDTTSDDAESEGSEES